MLYSLLALVNLNANINLCLIFIKFYYYLITSISLATIVYFPNSCDCKGLIRINTLTLELCSADVKYNEF